MFYSFFKKNYTCWNRHFTEGLRNYFSQFGRVDASTILRDSDGNSRGFAFLTFVEPASVDKVLAQDHVLDGKSVCKYYAKRKIGIKANYTNSD